MYGISRMGESSASSAELVFIACWSTEEAVTRVLGCVQCLPRGHSGARPRREPGIQLQPSNSVLDSGLGPSGRPGMTVDRAVRTGAKEGRNPQGGRKGHRSGMLLVTGGA